MAVHTAIGTQKTAISTKDTLTDSTQMTNSFWVATTPQVELPFHITYCKVPYSITV